jgi:hypothetical protein
MNGAQEEAVDEREGQAITAIREALSGTVMTVTRNVHHDIFSDSRTEQREYVYHHS